MKRSQVLPVTLFLAKAKLVFLGLALLSFVIPFSLSSSQLITGTIVNTILFSSAIFLPRKLFLPIIIFPSLGVLSRGLIFGPLTPFLFYFIPFIWLGNLSLVLVFKKTFPYLGYWLSVLLAALVKLTVLFSSASFFFRLDIVPRLFLTTMGFNQLVTACLGGFSAFLFFKKFSDGKI